MFDHVVEERAAQAIAGAKMAADEGDFVPPPAIRVHPNPPQLRPRYTLHAKPATARQPAKQLVGHEAFLKALEHSGATIVFTMNDGERFVGRIRHSDKYTISMELAVPQLPEIATYPPAPDSRKIVLFKHSIAYFEPTRRPEPANETILETETAA